jgi:hypothetical protein
MKSRLSARAARVLVAGVIGGWLMGMAGPAGSAPAVMSFPDPPAVKAPFNSAPKDLASNEQIFAWINDLCRMGNRRTGTEPDHQAAKYVLAKFQEFGLTDARLEPVPVPVWTATRWGLNVAGREVPCFYIAHSDWTGEWEAFKTAGSGLAAEMVYVGEGSEKDYRRIDVKGKIVLGEVRFGKLRVSDLTSVGFFGYDPDQTIPADWSEANPYSPNNFPGAMYRAAENGAVGFVGILTDYFDRNAYYNEQYAEKTCLMKVPGLWLSKSDGARVKALVANGPAPATLVLDGTIAPGTAYNVVGFVKGRSDDIIMVHSHHDAPWASAVEDASGVSEVLALAQYFGRAPAGSRDKTLMFITADTHFSLYQGHLDLIRQFREKKMNVILDIAIEHIGREVVEQDGKVVTTGQIEPRGIFVMENPYLISFMVQAVEKNHLIRTIMVPTYTPLGVPTDAGDFNRNKIPIISYISPPMYIYDEIDTPDKVAVEQLNPVATAFADVIESLDPLPARDITRRSFIPRYRARFLRAVGSAIKEMIVKPPSE